MLKREQILSANDISIERVDVPEWGTDPDDSFVFVKNMSGTERDAFEASVIQQRGKKTQIDTENIRAKLASLTICDESGVRIFTDADVRALGKKSAIALNRVFLVAQRLSGIGEEAITELTGGLQENPLDASPSD